MRGTTCWGAWRPSWPRSCWTVRELWWWDARRSASPVALSVKKWSITASYASAWTPSLPTGPSTSVLPLRSSGAPSEGMFLLPNLGNTYSKCTITISSCILLQKVNHYQFVFLISHDYVEMIWAIGMEYTGWFHIKLSEELRLLHDWRCTRGCLHHMIRWRGWLFLMLSSEFAPRIFIYLFKNSLFKKKMVQFILI